MAAVPVLAVSEAATPLRVELLSEEEGGGYRLEEGLTMALPSSALSADALQAWRMDETEASKRLDERGVDLALPSNLTLLVALRVRLGATGQEVDFGEEGLKLSLDAEAIPANAIPANAIPANGIPSNAIPSNALPSSALPSSALTKALPSSQVPAEDGGAGYFLRQSETISNDPSVVEAVDTTFSIATPVVAALAVLEEGVERGGLRCRLENNVAGAATGGMPIHCALRGVFVNPVVTFLVFVATAEAYLLEAQLDDIPFFLLRDGLDGKAENHVPDIFVQVRELTLGRAQRVELEVSADDPEGDVVFAEVHAIDPPEGLTADLAQGMLVLETLADADAIAYTVEIVARDTGYPPGITQDTVTVIVVNSLLEGEGLTPVLPGPVGADDLVVDGEVDETEDQPVGGEDPPGDPTEDVIDPQPGWSCLSGTCVQQIGGVFTTLAGCEAVCEPGDGDSVPICNEAECASREGHYYKGTCVNKVRFDTDCPTWACSATGLCVQQCDLITVSCE